MPCGTWLLCAAAGVAPRRMCSDDYLLAQRLLCQLAALQAEPGPKHHCSVWLGLQSAWHHITQCGKRVSRPKAKAGRAAPRSSLRAAPPGRGRSGRTFRWCGICCSQGLRAGRACGPAVAVPHAKRAARSFRRGLAPGARAGRGPRPAPSGGLTAQDRGRVRGGRGRGAGLPGRAPPATRARRAAAVMGCAGFGLFRVVHVSRRRGARATAAARAARWRRKPRAAGPRQAGGARRCLLGMCCVRGLCAWAWQRLGRTVAT